jgi:hypothetical protein
MDIQVLITTSTTDSTGPFNIVGNPGNVTIATGQTKNELVAGKTFTGISELINEIIITDTGVCSQAITRSVIGAGGTTPTPTPFPYSSNAITQYSSASRLDACTGGAQQTVFYAGNNIEMLMAGDYLYQDSAGTPVANGYYFKSSITYGVFYVTGSNGLIQTISDCDGQIP